MNERVCPHAEAAGIHTSIDLASGKKVHPLPSTRPLGASGKKVHPFRPHAHWVRPAKRYIPFPPHARWVGSFFVTSAISPWRCRPPSLVKPFPFYIGEGFNAPRSLGTAFLPFLHPPFSINLKSLECLISPSDWYLRKNLVTLLDQVTSCQK